MTAKATLEGARTFTRLIKKTYTATLWLLVLVLQVGIKQKGISLALG